MTSSFLDKRRIYVCGHQGFIGSHICHAIQSQTAAHLITATKQELDLCELKAVADFFSFHRPEIVIHCAGKVGGILANQAQPIDILETNSMIQLNLFRAARQNSVDKFIYFGSSCMYPQETVQPMKEWALFHGQPDPTSRATAIPKINGIQMSLEYNRILGHQVFVPIVLSNCVGPGCDFDLQKSHVLPALIRKIHQAKMQSQPTVTVLGSGKPKREFVFVTDVVRAVFVLLEHAGQLAHLPVNVGTGQSYSIAELAQRVANQLGFTGEIHFDPSHPDGPLNKQLCTQRLQSLGWQPQVDIDQAISMTCDWYVHHLQQQSSHAHSRMSFPSAPDSPKLLPCDSPTSSTR